MCSLDETPTNELKKFKKKMSRKKSNRTNDRDGEDETPTRNHTIPTKYNTNMADAFGRCAPPSAPATMTDVSAHECRAVISIRSTFFLGSATRDISPQ